MIDDNSIFIVGAKGQLGSALQAKYPNAKNADIDKLDITDKTSVNSYDWSNIRIILNAAAFTDVDGAETMEGRIKSWKVNAGAVGNLVEASIKNDITLIHISSDYVFDGTNDTHTEDEPLSPLGVYGQSKAAGDLLMGLAPKHYLLRTSWVIGNSKNFVKTMLDLGNKGVSPTVVSDQIGRLTFTSELVNTIDYLLNNNIPFGTYNISNDGDPVSWADVTRETFMFAGFDLSVTNTSTDDYYKGKDGIAPRPLKSTLSLDKIKSAGYSPADWREDLKEYVKREINS
jgi:dTDP-4-dehydrorhamnose 3,5-epimerase